MFLIMGIGIQLSHCPDEIESLGQEPVAMNVHAEMNGYKSIAPLPLNMT